MVSKPIGADELNGRIPKAVVCALATLVKAHFARITCTKVTFLFAQNVLT